MNFEALQKEWRNQESPSGNIISKIIERDEKLKKENLFITILFSSTIFILGSIVFAFLENTTTMLVTGGMMFLLGFQAFVFWMRNLKPDFIAEQNMEKKIRQTRRHLQYQLVVTNFFMPLYCVFLSVLCYLYINHLEMLPEEWKPWIVLVTLLYILVMFLIFWRKQRRKDKDEIWPLLEELK